MQKVNVKNIAWFTLIVFINIVLPILVFASFQSEHFKIYFNSDTLYLASIYKDIFIDKTGFTGWHLNAAPNFFPDMLLYFIIRPFFADFKIAYVVFSIVQYNIILVLIASLFKSVNKQINNIYPILFALMFPLFLLATVWFGSFQYTFHLFSQSYHSGGFINALIAYNLLFRYLNNPEKRYNLWLIIFTVLGTFNDRLFVVVFVAPLFAVWLFNFFTVKNRYLKQTGISVFIATLGSLVLYILTKNNAVYKSIALGEKFMNFKNAFPSFQVFWKQHLDFVVRHDVRAFITLSLLISTLLFIIWIFKIYKKTNKFTDFRDINIFELFFVIMMTVSVIITVFTPIINGYYVGTACIRYIMFAHYLAIFNLLFTFHLFFREQSLRIINYLSVIFVFINLLSIVYAVINLPVKDNLKKVVNYYPERVGILDDFSKKHHLQYGLAGYWDAKLSTMFSKNNQRVYTVLDGKLTIWYHVMNHNWYYDYDKGKFNKPVFKYVILDSLEYKKLKKILPVRTIDSIQYEGSTYIYHIQNFKIDKKTKKPYLPE